MIGLIMAGGKGTRMNSNQEKLLLKYKKPVILHVLDALRNSNCFSKIIAATSSNSPETEKLLQESEIEVISTSGKDFVTDLNLVLTQLQDSVFVTSGDIPLLDEKIIKEIVNNYDSKNIWTSIMITQTFLNSLGIKSEYKSENEKYVFSGISLVNAEKINDIESIKETFLVIDDKRIGFNLNTKDDYELLCST
jgi:adenosylcobinamide-phosphate guanylyltransferase